MYVPHEAMTIVLNFDIACRFRDTSLQPWYCTLVEQWMLRNTPKVTGMVWKHRLCSSAHSPATERCAEWQIPTDGGSIMKIVVNS
jgi:hypothetical protein